MNKQPTNSKSTSSTTRRDSKVGAAASKQPTQRLSAERVWDADKGLGGTASVASESAVAATTPPAATSATKADTSGAFPAARGGRDSSHEVARANEGAHRLVGEQDVEAGVEHAPIAFDGAERDTLAEAKRTVAIAPSKSPVDARAKPSRHS